MFSAFKASYSPEVTALTKKHGVSDALFIKNLGYFTNIDLNKVGEQGFIAMSTGVRKITSGLKDPAGLTSIECLILAFWSNHLGGAKVAFLTEHAHTIHEARGRTGPFSKHDLEFIRWTVDAIRREIATTDVMLAEVCTEHGDILDVEFEMRTEEGMKRLLTGKMKSQQLYTSGEEKMAARVNMLNSLFIKDQDMDKMTDPTQISTLAGVDMAISRIDAYRERLDSERIRLRNDFKALCHKKDFADKRLKALSEKRGYLASLK
ncbi:uncharacterized protein FSUBG_8770 [Fusarium subglutinans]|uniref:Uncharacterized protein n=1 Tax=Gibberella subglutinans TaxID=42677 RepID=A0A8H5PH03_GIBSU|nr:uncharacterized protein FSUBG_8770 [Fusarium subglutinans]KAF5596622.1 hypothetical protein FSUBG_8770 [Fusarium subglutinans]